MEMHPQLVDDLASLCPDQSESAATCTNHTSPGFWYSGELAGPSAFYRKLADGFLPSILMWTSFVELMYPYDAKCFILLETSK